MQILSLDTSSSKGTVALWSTNGKNVEVLISQSLDHARNLMPAINKMLEDNCVVPEEIDKIVVGAGPGSFIGTRIAVVAAQGLSAATGIEIEKVSSMRGYEFTRPDSCSQRNIFVCKAKSGTYNFICITHDAESYLEQELTDAEFAAFITPDDLLMGPLTEKNWANLQNLAGFELIHKSVYPSALKLITNSLSCAKQS